MGIDGTLMPPQSGVVLQTPGGREAISACPQPPVHARHLPFGLRGWAALAWLSAGQLLVVYLAATAVSAPSRLVAVAVLSQAPIVLGAAVAAIIDGRRRARRRAEREQLTALTSYVEEAEAVLARDQERLHELRATVSGIAISQRLLTADRTHLAAATRRRLERLREAGLERIERLLGDTQSDPVALVDLAEVLDPLVDAVRVRGHAVRWNGTRCRAMGRADDIAQIAHILLDNAARHGRGRHIELEVAERGGLIELRVSDHGPGIPPELAPVVFERGVRTATSRGEGIGLNIARRLARELGGDLRLEAVSGTTGAVFVLHLPHPTGAIPCHVRVV
jgi:signal transduction histidine kinase